jgi:hypothetical protein
VTVSKYLGVLVVQRLSWHAHLELMMVRTRKLMWVFKKLRCVADKMLLKLVYVSLAQSLLAYCILVWGGASKAKFKDLEIAQRALLKVIHFKPYRYSTQYLYKLSDVLSVRQIYILNAILKLHKSMPYDAHKVARRRKYNVALVPAVRTAYAKRQYISRSAKLYNKINKILNIYPNNTYTNKKSITSFLKSCNYVETEAFLEDEK